MSAIPTLKNFIDGQFTEVACDSYAEVVNPAKGETIARVPKSSPKDLNDAVQAAKVAHASWSELTIKQRAAIMFKFHDLIDRHSQELAQLVVQENGKNIVEALADVAKGNETVEWAASLPQMAGGRVLEVSKGITCEEHRASLGVVAAIVPFNFPAMVPMWTIPIALTMGNCVILKPSEKVPMTMMRMTELLVEAGMPKGVFQIVHGMADIVTAMCDHPDISAVTFVGSSKVAEIVANRCNAVHKRVLALGGAKNHLVALADCDYKMAARDIVASFAGCCGQRCMAASVLILVDEEQQQGEGNVLDGLLAEILETASKLLPGQEGGQVGPLIDPVAKKRVLQYIDEAESSGCKILLDGRKWAVSHPVGNWVGPTIILQNSREDPAMIDEIFGPVLSVLRVSSWQEAIDVENSNVYGNAACIYTERAASAQWFTKRFRAAMLGINIGIPVPREPFSFGGLYGTKSKYGQCDVTGDGAMEFFSNRIKITSKWSATYSSASSGVAKRSLVKTDSSDNSKKSKPDGFVDKANFDGRM
eukprot:gene32058-41575_t